MLYTKDVIETRLSLFLKQSQLAESTKRLYRTYSTSFFEWCYEKGIEPEEATQHLIREWLSDHKEWSPATRHSAISGLKSFYLYEFGEEHAVQKLKNKKPDNGPQRTLDEEELLKMFQACETYTIKGLRDLALLTLMADTGLRASEVANAELNRLSMKKDEITIKIKGGKWGRAIFFEYTHSCLENWLAVRPMIASEGKHLFVSIAGRTPGKKLTGFGVRHIVQRRSKMAGIDIANPHALRRAFATIAIKNGAPTRVVQVAGRWETINMVEHYSRALEADAIRKYSVVDSLMIEDPLAESN